MKQALMLFNLRDLSPFAGFPSTTIGVFKAVHYADVALAVSIKPFRDWLGPVEALATQK
jgi:hypothetical protein